MASQREGEEMTSSKLECPHVTYTWNHHNFLKKPKKNRIQSIER